MFIDLFLFYLKVYSFLEIKILFFMEYIYDLYYSDYYKMVLFQDYNITNQYINKNFDELEISTKKFDLLVIEDDKKCLLIQDKDEYLTFTLSYFMEKCNMGENITKIKLCNFTFSLIVIYIHNKEYEIKLKNMYYNYYVVGNRINHNFIKYYAYKYLQIKEPIVDYELTIIDHESNFVNNLNNKHTILFHENKYELK